MKSSLLTESPFLPVLINHYLFCLYLFQNWSLCHKAAPEVSNVLLGLQLTELEIDVNMNTTFICFYNMIIFMIIKALKALLNYNLVCSEADPEFCFGKGAVLEEHK